jgi:hypothetical protein
MNGVVVFDYTGWSARYPEFSTVMQATAQEYFNEAQLYCDNTPTSIVCDLCERSILLNQMTAHIAALNAPLNGQPSSPLVGRINSATEGSVSVSAQMDMPAGSAQWFNQTKYGAAFWQATAKYRSMRYVRGPVPVANPFTGFGRRR